MQIIVRTNARKLPFAAEVNCKFATNSKVSQLSNEYRSSSDRRQRQVEKIRGQPLRSEPTTRLKKKNMKLYHSVDRTVCFLCVLFELRRIGCSEW